MYIHIKAQKNVKRLYLLKFLCVFSQRFSSGAAGAEAAPDPRSRGAGKKSGDLSATNETVIEPTRIIVGFSTLAAHPTDRKWVSSPWLFKGISGGNVHL